MRIKTVTANVESDWLELTAIPVNSKRNVIRGNDVICYMDDESLPPVPVSEEIDDESSE